MLYELRIYHCVPGRLPDLLKRFDTITLGIWKRHGIEQAGFWTTAIGDSNQALHYLLKWESLADREKKWNAFQADPEWHSQARPDRSQRRDRRQGREQHPAADQLLGGEIDLANRSRREAVEAGSAAFATAEFRSPGNHGAWARAAAEGSYCAWQPRRGERRLVNLRAGS